MGVQEEGLEVLSCKVCVQGGCCIVSYRVVVGMQDEGFKVLSCKVCFQGGCCIDSSRVIVEGKRRKGSRFRLVKSVSRAVVV